jgi:hypothetical protein
MSRVDAESGANANAAFGAVHTAYLRGVREAWQSYAANANDAHAALVRGLADAAQVQPPEAAAEAARAAHAGYEKAGQAAAARTLEQLAGNQREYLVAMRAAWTEAEPGELDPVLLANIAASLSYVAANAVDSC